MEKMTIFYRKNNGKIVNISSGNQDYSLFQEVEKDYAMENYYILIVDEDQAVMNSPRNYRVFDSQVIPIGGN